MNNLTKNVKYFKKVGQGIPLPDYACVVSWKKWFTSLRKIISENIENAFTDRSNFLKHLRLWVETRNNKAYH